MTFIFLHIKIVDPSLPSLKFATKKDNYRGDRRRQLISKNDFTQNH